MIRLVLICAAVLLSVENVVAWLTVALSRFLEDSPVQWLEPLFLRSALQAYHGLPLYPQPSDEYIGAMYTPAVDLLNAAIMHIFGVGYKPLRVAAFLAFIGIVVVVGLWVYRQSGRRLWAAIVCSCLLTLDPALNHWFSSVNVDAWYILFCMIGAFVAFFHTGSALAIVMSGLCCGIAFLFKQQAILPTLAIFVYLLLQQRKKGIVFGISAAGLAGLVCLYFLVTSAGFFWTSAVTVPLRVPPKESFEFFNTLMRLSPWAVLFFVAFLPMAMLMQRQAGPGQNRTVFFALIGTAFLVLSYFSFRKVGGGENSLMPVLMLGFLLWGISPQLLQELGLARMYKTPVEVSYLVVALALLFFGMAGERRLAGQVRAAGSPVATWNALLPGNEAFEDRLRAVYAKQEGPVFVGARVLGSGPMLNTHQTPLYNWTKRARLCNAEDVIGPAFRTRMYRAVLYWEYPEDPMLSVLEGAYKKALELGVDPLIGFRVSLWVPKNEDNRGQGPRGMKGQ